MRVLNLKKALTSTSQVLTEPKASSSASLPERFREYLCRRCEESPLNAERVTPLYAASNSSLQLLDRTLLEEEELLYGEYLRQRPKELSEIIARFEAWYALEIPRVLKDGYSIQCAIKPLLQFLAEIYECGQGHIFPELIASVEGLYFQNFITKFFKYFEKRVYDDFDQGEPKSFSLMAFFQSRDCRSGDLPPINILNRLALLNVSFAQTVLAEKLMTDSLGDISLEISEVHKMALITKLGESGCERAQEILGCFLNHISLESWEAFHVVKRIETKRSDLSGMRKLLAMPIKSNQFVATVLATDRINDYTTLGMTASFRIAELQTRAFHGDLESAKRLYEIYAKDREPKTVDRSPTGKVQDLIALEGIFPTYIGNTLATIYNRNRFQKAQLDYSVELRLREITRLAATSPYAARLLSNAYIHNKIEFADGLIQNLSLPFEKRWAGLIALAENGDADSLETVAAHLILGRRDCIAEMPESFLVSSEETEALLLNLLIKNGPVKQLGPFFKSYGHGDFALVILHVFKCAFLGLKKT